jgi:hypothetical protein
MVGKGVMGAGLDPDRLQDSPLGIVEVAREHAVARRVGKLGQEICQVGLKKTQSTRTFI